MRLRKASRIKRVSFTESKRKEQKSESRSHKVAANRIAAKFNTEYNDGPGADVKTNKVTVEVETPETVADAGRQLQGHRGPVFVAGTNKEATDAALEMYSDSTIGVMDNQGNILKDSTRK